MIFPSLARLPVKLALAVASVAAWVLIGVAMDRLEPLADVLAAADIGFYLAAIIFGALVMAPYVTATRFRAARILGLCAASAGIYWSAVAFITEGPFGYDTILPYLISGGVAALLVGVAVVWLAPRVFGWRLAVLTIAAGAVGGAVFELDLSYKWIDELLLGHLAWQLLVCAALHFGLRPARAPALP